VPEGCLVTGVCPLRTIIEFGADDLAGAPGVDLPVHGLRPVQFRRLALEDGHLSIGRPWREKRASSTDWSGRPIEHEALSRLQEMQNVLISPHSRPGTVSLPRSLVAYLSRQSRWVAVGDGGPAQSGVRATALKITRPR
jgi:hypothetical protein